MKDFNKKKIYVRTLILLFAVGFIFTSCSKDDDDYTPPSSQSSSTSSSVTKPALAKNLTTTTYSEVNFMARFSNGGDTYDNMKCTVHWASYAKKQATTPKASELTRKESMTQFNTTSKNTTFKKSHTGLSGGTYI